MSSTDALLYGINPRRPIKNLNDDIPIIRTNKSFYLTKDEVKKCLPYAAVWRKFTVDHIERVTIGNLDRLHNDKFYSEKEWENVKQDKLGENRGKVSEPVNAPIAEEKVTNTITESEEQPAGETIVEETTPDTSSDAAPSEETESEPVVIEEAKNDDETIEPISEETQEADDDQIIVDDEESNSSDDVSELSVNESSNIDVNTDSHNSNKKKKRH